MNKSVKERLEAVKVTCAGNRFFTHSLVEKDVEEFISLLEESISEWIPEEISDMNYDKIHFEKGFRFGWNKSIRQTEENFRKWLKGEK